MVCLSVNSMFGYCFVVLMISFLVLRFFVGCLLEKDFWRVQCSCGSELAVALVIVGHRMPACCSGVAYSSSSSQPINR